MRWRIELLAVAAFAGCATAPLPAPEWTSDWKVQQGQAVWKPDGGEGIAGELLVATNSTGDFVIDFSKPPIAIAHAHRVGSQWEFGFPADNKSYRGRGKGPSRVIWLRLAPALLGGDKQWQLTTNENGWAIRNRSGETLEGFLSP